VRVVWSFASLAPSFYAAFAGYKGPNFSGGSLLRGDRTYASGSPSSGTAIDKSKGASTMIGGIDWDLKDCATEKIMAKGQKLQSKARSIESCPD
jgi:hypothetical protein